jgi:hypothetical protein
MDTDGHETAVAVLIRPSPDIRQCAKAVDAGIGAFTVSAVLIVVLRLFGGRYTGGGFPVATALAAAFAAGAALAGVAAGSAQIATTAAYAAKNPAASAAKLSLFGARQWLNTAPLQATDLRGKVVLVKPSRRVYASLGRRPC